MNTDLADEKPKARIPRQSNFLRIGKGAWLVLYGLNLIVPVALATNFVQGSSWTGVVAAVLLLAGVGFPLLCRYSIMVSEAVIGAALVGLSQFWPIVQIFTGSWAIQLTRWLVNASEGSSFGGDLGVFASFLATIFTGTELLAISLVLGSIPIALRNLFRKVKRWRAKTPVG